jgi:hypothetical protein
MTVSNLTPGYSAIHHLDCLFYYGDYSLAYCINLLDALMEIKLVINTDSNPAFSMIGYCVNFTLLLSL